ncbi:hypothetical protein IV102_05215 [bacterium]|nr:hypothetical protein [bacterium]
MNKHRRASSLAGTLCFIALLGILTFAASGYSISHLTVSRRMVNEKMAGDLAESAANLALARLMEEPAWRGSIDHRPSNAPSSYGRATFSESQADRWNIDPSYNNLMGKQSQQASDRLLGPETLQVLGYGSHNGIVKRCEILLHVPPYRYALVSNGQVTSTGGMTVAGVEDPSLLADGLSNVAPEQLQYGYLAANSDSEEAVVLESSADHPTRVTGGVESVGGVRLGEFTQVAGAVKEHASPAPMVHFTIGDYDPAERSQTLVISDGTTGRYQVRGVSRRQGDLHVTGGLHIQRGYLYVDGDLLVQGGIHGTGCVFATGKIRIEGVSSFAADAKEALMAGGDIEIEGTDQDKSIFQGIVYTRGNFSAKRVTLLGTVLAGDSVGSAGSAAQVTLDQVNVVHCPSIVSSEWDSGFSPTPWVAGFDTAVRFRADRVQSAEIRVSSGNKPEDFFDAAQDRYTMTPSDHTVEPKYKIGLPEFALVNRGRFFNFSTLQDAMAVLNNSSRKESIRAYQIVEPPRRIPVMTETIDAAGNRVATLEYVEESGTIDLDDPSDPRFQAAASSYIRTVQGLIWQTYLPSLVEAYQEEYARGRKPWMNPDRWGLSFDPNQFVQLSQKTRKLVVRETLVQP